MIRHLKSIIVMTALCAVMIGCDKESNRAEDLISSFMEENMVDYSSATSKEYGRLDSTVNVTPQRIEKMHQSIKQNKDWRNNIHYSAGKVSGVLLFMPVEYDLPQGGDKKRHCRQTFYFDREATHIIAFKDN